MEQIFYEIESKYGFDETIDKLSEIILEEGWKVIQMLDLQGIMKNNGKDVLPVKVIELCKADYAYRILSDDKQRIYSNMLPCRISVYEKEDGKTRASLLDVALLANEYRLGEAPEVMTKALNEAKGFLKKVSTD